MQIDTTQPKPQPYRENNENHKLAYITAKVKWFVKEELWIQHNFVIEYI